MNTRINASIWWESTCLLKGRVLSFKSTEVVLKEIHNSVPINWLMQSGFHYFLKLIKLKQSKFYKHICTVTIISRKTFKKVPQTFKKTERSCEKIALKLFFF